MNAQAAQVTPSEPNDPFALSVEVQPVPGAPRAAHVPELVIVPKFGSAEETVGTIERLFRAIQAERIDVPKARLLTNVCRAAAEMYREHSPIPREQRANRARVRVQEGMARLAPGPPEPPDEPAQPAEPSFEERVLGRPAGAGTAGDGPATTPGSRLAMERSTGRAIRSRPPSPPAPSPPPKTPGPPLENRDGTPAENPGPPGKIGGPQTQGVPRGTVSDPSDF